MACLLRCFGGNGLDVCKADASTPDFALGSKRSGSRGGVDTAENGKARGSRAKKGDVVSAATKFYVELFTAPAGCSQQDESPCTTAVLDADVVRRAADSNLSDYHIGSYGTPSATAISRVSREASRLCAVGGQAVSPAPPRHSASYSRRNSQPGLPELPSPLPVISREPSQQKPPTMKTGSLPSGAFTNKVRTGRNLSQAAIATMQPSPAHKGIARAQTAHLALVQPGGHAAPRACPSAGDLYRTTAAATAAAPASAAVPTATTQSLDALQPRALAPMRAGESCSAADVHSGAGSSSCGSLHAAPVPVHDPPPSSAGGAISPPPPPFAVPSTPPPPAAVVAPGGAAASVIASITARAALMPRRRSIVFERTGDIVVTGLPPSCMSAGRVPRRCLDGHDFGPTSGSLAAAVAAPASARCPSLASAASRPNLPPDAPLPAPPAAAAAAAPFVVVSASLPRYSGNGGPSALDSVPTFTHPVLPSPTPPPPPPLPPRPPAPAATWYPHNPESESVPLFSPFATSVAAPVVRPSLEPSHHFAAQQLFAPAHSHDPNLHQAGADGGACVDAGAAAQHDQQQQQQHRRQAASVGADALMGESGTTRADCSAPFSSHLAPSRFSASSRLMTHGVRSSSTAIPDSPTSTSFSTHRLLAAEGAAGCALCSAPPTHESAVPASASAYLRRTAAGLVAHTPSRQASGAGFAFQTFAAAAAAAASAPGVSRLSMEAVDVSSALSRLQEACAMAAALAPHERAQRLSRRGSTDLSGHQHMLLASPLVGDSAGAKSCGLCGGGRASMGPRRGSAANLTSLALPEAEVWTDDAADGPCVRGLGPTVTAALAPTHVDVVAAAAVGRHSSTGGRTGATGDADSESKSRMNASMLQALLEGDFLNESIEEADQGSEDDDEGGIVEYRYGGFNMGG